MWAREGGQRGALESLPAQPAEQAGVTSFVTF